MLLAHDVQRLAAHHAVGPGEVDELEDAEGRARALELDALAAQAVLAVGDDDLARLDLAHEVGADDVEAGRLAADHRVALVVAEAERAHAVGVAEADHGVAAHDGRGEGAADLADRRAHRASSRSPSASCAMSAVMTSVSVVPENLTPWRDELVAQLRGVHEVAVVAQGDDVAVAAAHQRLRVRPVARARGAVAHVADGVLAAEALQHLLVEHLADEAQVLDDRDLAVVGSRRCRRSPGRGAAGRRARRRSGARRRVPARGCRRRHSCRGDDRRTRRSVRVRRAAPGATHKQNGARSPGRRRAPSHPWYTAGRSPVTRPSRRCGRSPRTALELGELVRRAR